MCRQHLHREQTVSQVDDTMPSFLSTKETFQKLHDEKKLDLPMASIQTHVDKAKLNKKFFDYELELHGTTSQVICCIKVIATICIIMYVM